jgi:hypothetical protein
MRIRRGWGCSLTILGREVRHEQDDVTNSFHDYVHATSDPKLAVVWEAYRDPTTNHYVGQQDDAATGKKIRTDEHQSPDVSSPIVLSQQFDLQGNVTAKDAYIMSGTHTDRHEWTYYDTNRSVANKGWETYSKTPWGGDLHQYDKYDFHATQKVAFSTRHGSSHDWYTNDQNRGHIFGYTVSGKTQSVGEYWVNGVHHVAGDELINPFG